MHSCRPVCTACQGFYTPCRAIHPPAAPTCVARARSLESHSHEATQRHEKHVQLQHATTLLPEAQLGSTPPYPQATPEGGAPRRRRYRPSIASTIPWLHADPGEEPDNVVLPSHRVTAQVVAATTSAILATSVPMLAACWEVPLESVAPNLGTPHHNQPAAVAAAVTAASSAERAQRTLQTASWLSPVSMQPAQLVNTIYQLGKQGQVPSAQWMQECLDACELLFLQQARSRRAEAASIAPRMASPAPPQTQHTFDKVQPSNPAPLTWGSAVTSPPLQGSTQEALSSNNAQLTPHQLCLLLWGLVRLHQKQQGQPAWPRPSSAWVEALCAAALQIIQSGCTAFDRPSKQTKATAMQHEDTGRQQFERRTLRAMSTTVWAMAALQLRPSNKWLAEWTGVTQPALSHMNSQDIVQLVWGCARIGHAPLPAWMQAAMMRARQLMRVEQFVPQDFSNLLWSCARLGYDPGDQYLAQAYDVLTPCQARDQANAAVLHAQSAQHLQQASAPVQQLGGPADNPVNQNTAPQQPCMQVEQQLELHSQHTWQHDQPHVNQGMSAPDQHAHMQQPPHQVPEVSPQLAAFEPRDIVQALWALGRLRKRPPANTVNLLLYALTQRGCTSLLSEQDLVNLMWGIVRLQYKPGPELRAWLTDSIRQALEQQAFTPRGLPTLLWCLSRLQWKVPKSLVHRLIKVAAVLAKRLTLEGVAMVLYIAARKEHQLDAWHLASLAEAVATYTAEPGQGVAATTAQQAQHSQSGGSSHSSEGKQQQGLPLDMQQQASLSVQAALDEVGDMGLQAANQSPTAGSGTGLWCTGTSQSAGLLLWSLAKLHYRPSAAWLRVMAAGTVQLLPSASATDLCFMLWALGSWRHRPPRYWAFAALRRAAELKANNLMRPDQASRVAFHMSVMISKSQLQAALRCQQTRQEQSELTVGGQALARPVRYLSFANH